MAAASAEERWPADSFARLSARKIRRELVAVVGAAGANVLLRVVSRDGRLYPGLAAPTDPNDYVNSEKEGVTSPDEVALWFAGVPADEIRRRNAAGARLLAGS